MDHDKDGLDKFPVAVRDALKRASKLVRDADYLIFTSGAGMGVDSGLGTFRGAAAGHWQGVDGKLLPDGSRLEWEDLSTPVWFEGSADGYMEAGQELSLPKSDAEARKMRDIRFAWSFWLWRYNLYVNKSAPHQGYHIMKEWALDKGGFHKVMAYTSNIDGHWIEAGFPQDRVCEIHGSVRYLQCVRGEVCKPLEAKKKKEREAEEDDDEEEEEEDYQSFVWPSAGVLSQMKLTERQDSITEDSPIPRCPHCADLARPNVLMFSDWRQVDPRYTSPAANYGHLWKTIEDEKASFCIVEVGCGIDVDCVRNHGELAVRGTDGRGSLIRINVAHSYFPPALAQKPEIYVSIPLGALAALQAIDNLIKVSPSD